MAVIVTVSLLMTACGIRVSRADVVAAERGTASSATSVGGALGPGDASAAATGRGASGADGAGTGADQGTGGTSASVGGTAGRGGSAGSGAASAPSGTSGAATQSPIVIGAIGDWSSVSGASIEPARQAMLAWAAWTNAHGGINGHRVVWYGMDTQSDNGKAKQYVQELVERQKAVAIVGDANPFTYPATDAYLKQADVPVIGASNAWMAEYQNPNVFPVGTRPDAGAAAIVKAVHDAGKRKLAIIYCEVAACADSAKQIEAAAPKYGVQIAYSAQASIASPDYTADCLQAQQRGADSFFTLEDGSAFDRVRTSCSRQGYHPQYVVYAATALYDTPKAPDGGGVIAVSREFPYASVDGSERRAFQQAMRQYAHGTQYIGEYATYSWTAAEVFKKVAIAAMAANGGSLTRAGIIAALHKLHNETVGGLSPPLSFPQGAKEWDIGCYFTMQASGGRWVDGDRGNYSCV